MAATVTIIESTLVDIGLIEPNIGQIPGVPENPKTMPEVEYQKLKASLTSDRDFTGINEIALYPHNGRYVVIHGNMRVRAAKELGWPRISAKVLPADTPPEALTRYILLGNAAFGKWNTAKLAESWADLDLEALNSTVPPPAEPLNPDELGEEFVLPEGDRSDERRITFSLSTSQSAYIDHVLALAKKAGLTPDPRYSGNKDEDANYIHLIALQWDAQKK